MEDALVLMPLELGRGTHHECLNPCCNGRCTRTLHCRFCRIFTQHVLILVVMEDALVHETVGKFLIKSDCRLNPCCNGRCTRTLKETISGRSIKRS